MSQAGSLKGTGGGGSGIIQTIAGDSGSITGANVTIYANNAANNSGGSVNFVNSGTISTLNVTDSNNNTFIGKQAGTTTITGIGRNCCFGYQSGRILSTGFANVFVGSNAGNNALGANNNVGIGDGILTRLQSGSANTCIGVASVGFLLSGNNNLILGDSSGGNYTTSESQNILLKNAGITGESNVIRIGTAVNQTTCYIQGITGNTVSNQQYVTIDSSTGQLGVTSTAGSGVYFQAYLTSNQNIAGGSTSTAIVFNSAASNVGAAYNTGTGVFTAPATGYYAFTSVVYYHLLTSLAGNTQAILAYTGSVQSLRLIYVSTSLALSGDLICNASWSMPMTSGDTVKMVPYADGTGTYQIFGTALTSTPFNTSSTFSGYRVA